MRGEVVNLTESKAEGGGVVGPGPGLEKYRRTPDLRVIGRQNYIYCQLVRYVEAVQCRRDGELRVR